MCKASRSPWLWYLPFCRVFPFFLRRCPLLPNLVCAVDSCFCWSLIVWFYLGTQFNSRNRNYFPDNWFELRVLGCTIDYFSRISEWSRFSRSVGVKCEGCWMEINVYNGFTTSRAYTSYWEIESVKRRDFTLWGKQEAKNHEIEDPSKKPNEPNKHPKKEEYSN